jgi:hypothetical protein
LIVSILLQQHTGASTGVPSSNRAAKKLH